MVPKHCTVQPSHQLFHTAPQVFLRRSPLRFCDQQLSLETRLDALAPPPRRRDVPDGPDRGAVEHLLVHVCVVHRADAERVRLPGALRCGWRRACVPGGRERVDMARIGARRLGVRGTDLLLAKLLLARCVSPSQPESLIGRRTWLGRRRVACLVACLVSCRRAPRTPRAPRTSSSRSHEWCDEEGRGEKTAGW